MKTKDKKCIICYKKYTPNSNYQKTCSIECRKEQNRRYRKEYNKKNKDIIKEQKKEWKRRNPKKIKRWREKEKAKRKLNDYHKKPEVIKSKRKWREKNKKYNKKYYKKNKKRIGKKQIEYEKKKMKQDKNFNIQKKLRNRLRNALREFTKTGKIMSYKKYGINYKAIIEHLKPFPKNLKNYEIHHIKPLFTFNFINKDGSTNLKEVGKAFLPENHRWVTIKEHKKIHNKRK